MVFTVSGSWSSVVRGGFRGVCMWACRKKSSSLVYKNIPRYENLASRGAKAAIGLCRGIET